ncbi:helix-turn-helix domain-containing protein [Providencia sneebia]|uniref:Transcriptional regulator n=1 Tax=Providencia sneebia DSM 19967 TaxID=1141660 RepID=K8WRU2_9GAMM|nr:transcriptional regulator [Providencia sneebia DSM 19967]
MHNGDLLTVKQYINYAIGRQIYRIRKSRGLTGNELAKKMNISQQQISRYERGTCRIDLNVLICILHALKITLGDFFVGVSLILKEVSPETYVEYNALFYPVINSLLFNDVIQKINNIFYKNRFI